ncbi:MAG TPA: alpha-L-fucosidase [Candidatus Angelobacter sp.]
MRRREFLQAGTAAGIGALTGRGLAGQQAQSPSPGSSAPAQNVDHQWWSDKVDPKYHNAAAAAVESWKDQKFGMRIHWGPYSVLGVDASWPLQGSSKEFQDIYFTLYQVFNPTGFNADEWAELAERAGMKYFVFTTRHHDGFSMFDTKTEVDSIRRIPSKKSDGGIGATEKCRIRYSMMDTLYPKDIVAELARAYRKRNLGVGLYYSWPDWHDPDFQGDKHSMFYDPRSTRESDPQRWQRFINRIREQVRELCTNYGDLFEISFDANLPQAVWPETVKIVEMARTLQPSVMFRERGIGPYGDFTTPEHWIPADPLKKPLGMPWEAINQLGTQWAYTPNDTYKSKEWLLGTLIDVVAKGGNFMPGVSPMANGKFPQETIERLEYAGAWLRVNGEAIYKTRPWNIFHEGEDIRFTQSEDKNYLYAISLKWPGKTMVIRSVRAVEGSEIVMLGAAHKLRWHQDNQGLVIEIPQALDQRKPCDQAYTFKIQAQPFQASSA